MFLHWYVIDMNLNILLYFSFQSEMFIMLIGPPWSFKDKNEIIKKVSKLTGVALLQGKKT